MSEKKGSSGSDLFIVDNSDKEWKVLQYLQEWAEIAHTFDIATGYFEIGALLALDGQWQKLDKLRILMGNEVTKRTKQALLEGIDDTYRRLDESIEEAKKTDDFLEGVPSIVEALQKRQIECRAYVKNKFHAKAYITHAKQAVVGSSALVGSSNFTKPGLTNNVELNVQLRREVEILQEWFERHWDEAEDITPEILRVIERHTHEYSPFEVYAKALQEYLRGYEMTVGDWEKNDSAMYGVLDQYQREGYQALMKIARHYGGALLCDGVGLGKTFVGLMVIERLVEYERKRVALFVPKAARKPVWEKELNKYLPHISGEAFNNLVIFNHTDLSAASKQSELERVSKLADVVIIDEAHHFRNPGVRGEGEKQPSRYWRMFEIAEGKTVFLLTATPVNNQIIDLQRMIELFSRRQYDYFKAAPLGIHNLRSYFRNIEKTLEELIFGQELEDREGLSTNETEAEKVLHDDRLFKALVVQRSRAYVKRSQEQFGGEGVAFPKREDPKVAEYSIKKTYGRLLEIIEKAFSKENPLFSLAMYYPLAYYKGDDKKIDPFMEGRQRQVVGLIRTLFLKRFESSAHAFQSSCETLLLKLLAFVEKNIETEGEKSRFDRWKRQNEKLLGLIHEHQLDLFEGENEEDFDEDIIPDEMRDKAVKLSREEYRVEDILAETYLDLEQIAVFLDELRKFKSSSDDKLKKLKSLLKTDSVLKKHKVLIFTEFMDTAKYLRRELESAGIEGVDEVHSMDKRDRSEVLARFAPYYNGSTSGELAASNISEIRVLVSTDVLSEGLNLQDATRLINYDLHWNPVRLMQRIGRLDRRLAPDTEKQIIKDHPDQKAIRGTVAYWNFLPPDELNSLLHLYSRVTQKTLTISKTFGIEGRKLLTPDDDYEALREFNHSYEGTASTAEEMHLEFQQLLKDFPDLEGRLDYLPGRVFSGKEHPSEGCKAVFFCYAMPAPPGAESKEEVIGPEDWSEKYGFTQWYLYDIDAEEIFEEPSDILEIIRSTPETPRYRSIPNKTLSEIRISIEKHIRNTYLKNVQAPVGVSATLKAWMELS